jgi:hypothetical protein
MKTRKRRTPADVITNALGRVRELHVRRSVKRRTPADVITNAHRVFGELIERSEQPPRRGNLKKVAPPPAKKNSATK